MPENETEKRDEHLARNKRRSKWYKGNMKNSLNMKFEDRGYRCNGYSKSNNKQARDMTKNVIGDEMSVDFG